MIPRFPSEEEKAYYKMFKDNDPFNASCFYYNTDKEEYHKLLRKATNRGTPITQKELYILCESKKTITML